MPLHLRCARAALAAVLAAALAAGDARAAAGEPTAWLADYLRIDTSNPPGNEHRAAAFLAGILHREGIETRLVVSPGGRVNLIARLAASEPAGGSLVLLHHMDVVPPGAGWSVEPFAGASDGSFLWGRGAIDAKSLGIAHLAAFVDLARRKAPLARDLVFVAAADEESGGAGGVAWLLERYPELFAGAAAVLGEGGQNRARRGTLVWWGIEVAQKRPLWLAAKAHGRGGHGSSLNLHTATHRLVRGLARLVDRPPALRLVPEVRSYFEAVAPHESPYFRRLLGEMDEVLAGPEPGRRLLPGLPSLLADSIQVNVLDAGERINVTPDEAVARIDARLLPDTDDEALLAEIRALLGDEIEVEVLLSAPRVAPSPSDGELYRCLEATLGERGPVVPAFIAGVTDARHFRAAGIPAYGFSPFELGGLDHRGVHGPDERISLAEFERGVRTMTEVVRRCAGS